MFIQLLITLLSLTFAQHAQIQNSENADIIYLLFVNATSLRSRDCGTYGDPCRQIDDVIRLLESSKQYEVNVSVGQYDHDLFIFYYLVVQGKQYPTVDIVAEGNTQMNLIGQQFPIGQIIVSYSKFIIDIGNKYFLIDDDGSSLKFSNCTMLRNAGNSALNAYSLAVVNYGSLILEKLNINGNSLEGNLPMIQATQPKLIQITSLTLANLKLGSGNAQPLLLSVTELTNGSNIIIKYLSMIQNTAGTQAETGIIFVNKKDQSGSSTQTILSIENSEIVHNSLAPITEACAVQIQGLKPQQILIKNSTIENISPPNNNKQYEFKIILPSGSVSQNLIDQFQTVEFGVTLNPVAAKTLPNKHFDYLELPLSKEYADIRVDSNGLEECTSYIANYYQDVKSVGCAVIIIRAQETQEQLKGIPRSVSIVGTFTENDLRTDDLIISFTGINIQTTSNIILYQPNLTISYNQIDSSLFHVHDGGFITLTRLNIQRSNISGSENAPIALIISGTGQQSNEFRNNSPGQLVINNCIFEGGNSISSDVWYNLGLAETCNVGYGAAIVADGQTVVQISGSTIKTFEGPAVRASNGARVSIDRNTVLDNNGLRNRNTLSSMQTNVVCEGDSGVTTINIALDNVTSFASTGNAWIYQQSYTNCFVTATVNYEPAQPRSVPYGNSANITVDNKDQTVEVAINGKFLEPCMRTLFLGLIEKNRVDQRTPQEFLIENPLFTNQWISSEILVILIPSYLLNSLNSSFEWQVSVYELGKKDQANWITVKPSIIGEVGPDQPGDETEVEPKESKSKTTLIVSIVVPVVVIAAVIIIIVVIALYVRHKNKEQRSNDSNIQLIDILSGVEVRSLKEEDEQEEQNNPNKQKHKPQTHVSTYFFPESDTEKRVSSEHSNSRDYEPDQKQRYNQNQSQQQQQQYQLQLQEEEEEERKQTKQLRILRRRVLQDQVTSNQPTSGRNDSNLGEKDQKDQKDQKMVQTEKQRQISKDSRKPSKQGKEINNKQKDKQNKEKRRKSRKISKEKQRSDSDSSESEKLDSSESEKLDSSRSLSSYSPDSDLDSSSSSSSQTHSSDNDHKQSESSSSSMETPEMNELRVKEVPEKKKKEMKENDHANATANNKKTSKKKIKNKEKNKDKNKADADNQKQKDKIKTHVLYQEEEMTPQPPDNDSDSLSSSTSSSDSEVKYQEKVSSILNKRKAKTSETASSPPKKDKIKTKLQKSSNTRSKSQNSSKPSKSNSNRQQSSKSSDLTSDLVPQLIVLPDFDESQVVLHRDTRQDQDQSAQLNNNPEVQVERSLESSESMPPLLEGLVVDFQVSSKGELQAERSKQHSPINIKNLTKENSQTNSDSMPPLLEGLNVAFKVNSRGEDVL